MTDYLAKATAPNGEMCGYVIGKAEGIGKEWHGHVTAVTVAPEYRKIGYATKLMKVLEQVSENTKSNLVGVQMYEKMGYVIYRTVLGYYAGGDGEEQEDARDMRKSLKRDPKKLSMQPYPGGTIRPHELKDSL